MERRKFTKLVASGVAVSVAGCTGGDGGEGGNPQGSDDNEDNAGGGNSSGEYGLPSCDGSNRQIKVRGATVTDSNYDGTRDAYRNEIRVVVEVLGAEKQVVRVNDFVLLDENGDRLTELEGTSENFELQPAATKQFEFVIRTEEEATAVNDVYIQALPVDEWEAASLAEWQNSDNKGCY